jgi:hypothetical protein
VGIPAHGHARRIRPAPDRAGHQHAVLRAACENAEAAGQPAVLRCTAAAVVADERETSIQARCPNRLYTLCGLTE